MLVVEWRALHEYLSQNVKLDPLGGTIPPETGSLWYGAFCMENRDGSGFSRLSEAVREPAYEFVQVGAGDFLFGNWAADLCGF